MNRTPLFRKVIVACAAAVSLGAAVMPSTQTSAWSYDAPSGSRGNVSLPTIYVGDLLMPSGYTQFTLYSNTGPTAYRSPAASGVQTVRARYRVEYWNGAAWTVTTQSPLLTGQIGSSQTGVVFTGAYLQPTIARGSSESRGHSTGTTPEAHGSAPRSWSRT